MSDFPDATNCRHRVRRRYLAICDDPALGPLPTSSPRTPEPLCPTCAAARCSKRLSLLYNDDIAPPICPPYWLPTVASPTCPWCSVQIRPKPLTNCATSSSRHPACHACSSIRRSITPERLPLPVAQHLALTRRSCKRARASSCRSAEKVECSTLTVFTARTVVPTPACQRRDRKPTSTTCWPPSARGVEMLIRAAWDRCVDGAALCVRPSRPSPSSPRSSCTCASRPAARSPATLSLRYSALTLCPPRTASARLAHRCAVAVLREVEPPPPGSPLSGCC